MPILAAVLLAVVMSYAWSQLAAVLRAPSDLWHLVTWAVEGAVVALAARVAGRRRWAVGIPLLLVLVGGTGAGYTVFMSALGGTGRYAPPWGIVAGVLLGLLVVGPAILVPAARDAGRPQVAGGRAEAGSRCWDLAAVATALCALGMMATALLLTGSARDRSLESIGKDLRPAVEDLVRSDVLSDLGPVTWQGPWWSGQNRVVAQAIMPGSGRALRWYGDVPVRQSGVPGSAEGLRTGSLNLLVEVVQPRTLTDQEAGDAEFVKTVLTSVGVRAELVAGLSPGMRRITGGEPHLYTTSRNGLSYVITINKPGSQTLLYTVNRDVGTCIAIYGGGVRSADSRR